MNQFKIFQVEKNNEDIRRTVLTNLIKMLTERKLMNAEDLETNITALINTQSDDYSYTLTVNGDTEADRTLAVKIFNQKITAISKQSSISDFLYKHKDVRKIAIVKDINTKAAQYMTINHSKTEIFKEDELMSNLIDFYLVPKYELVDPGDDDYKSFCHEYNSKKRQIPKMEPTDPVARYYNLKRGDIVRILRPSESSVVSPSYRIVK